ncbi:hypothetical protein E1166_16690 [Micromonospora sp. KC213]|nr:hypothetical protein E1166_16690 [Micromonospora sp. KC213]
MPADRDRLDPTQDFDQGPPGPVPVAPCRVFVSPPILLCATDEDATRHPCAASETPVAGRTALPATPPTRQGPIFGGIAGESLPVFPGGVPRSFADLRRCPGWIRHGTAGRR